MPTAGALAGDDIAAIVEGRHGDPFAVLGVHDANGGVVVRAFVPGADTLEAIGRDGQLLAFSASSANSRQSQVWLAQADGSKAKLMTPSVRTR